MRYDKPVTVGDVRRGLDEIKLGSAIIQQFGDAQEYLIRLPQGGERPEQVTPKVQAALAKASGAKVEMRRVEFVGPQVGRDLQLQALYAVLAGMAGILIYVAIRFDFRGGVISIVAIAHDVIVTLGALTIFNFEMSLSVLAALLTIVGYSINDTIVIFDRIRESRGRGLRKGQTLANLVNTSLNQTLSRTILTSFTTFMASRRPLRVRGGSAAGLCLRARRGRGARHLLDDGRRVAHRGLGDVEPEPPELAAQGARQGIAKKTARNAAIRGSINGQPQEANG